MDETDGRALLLLNREWQRLQSVIDTRAAEAREYRDLHGKEETPGMCSGLMVKRVHSTKRGTTRIYTLDCKTLRGLRALERFAMKIFLEQHRQEAAECLPIVIEAVQDLPVSLTVRRGGGSPAGRPERAKRAA